MIALVSSQPQQISNDVSIKFILGIHNAAKYWDGKGTSAALSTMAFRFTAETLWAISAAYFLQYTQFHQNVSFR